MFQNYSETYAATITTFAGVLGLYLNRFGIANSDIELTLSSLVCLGGIVWQIMHRKSKGGVSMTGVRL